MLPSRSTGTLGKIKFIIQQPFSLLRAASRTLLSESSINPDGCLQSLISHTVGLDYLPVELLYHIQLLALSEHLPLTSRHLKNVFDSSPNSFRAQYITQRIIPHSIDWPPNLYCRVLRYRLCTPPVLDMICTRCASATNQDLYLMTELPKHLFRRLDTRKRPRSDADEPLPFLRLIDANPAIPPLNVNANSGFALTMAVHASFIPLIHHLLEMGANPAAKDAIAIIVAIRKKDLYLVRMLVEHKSCPKRWRIPDRMRCSEFPELLKVAIKVDARDIVDYLREKGCVPDLGMIKSLSS
ncbi:hypothetical protein BDZ89DRAFT_1020705 [Hymenopellis radicata]|nr:hypothetical protein BDZ89DRAFT_1020705 [Hymenopellis radicata]